MPRNITRGLSISIGLLLIAAPLLFSRTLAETITLGIGNIESGQGVQLVTSCDSSIFAQPIPISIDGVYYLDGIEFSGIDISSCDNREFKIRAYTSPNVNASPQNFTSGISEVSVRLYGGLFYSETNHVRLSSGDSKGWFLVQFDQTPTLTSANLKKITLTSERAGSISNCNVTPDDSATVGLTFTFTSVGACLFTSSHTKNGATLEVVGGGGGGGGGSVVESGFSGVGGGGGGGGGGEVLSRSVNLIANSKYLIIVGKGGSGGLGGSSPNETTGSAGKDGHSSAAFGSRAIGGKPGLGASSNLDSNGLVTTTCTGSSTIGTGGIGGDSGGNNSGGNKSCSHSGGGGGGGSGGFGSSPSSIVGAAGGAGLFGLLGTYSLGGAGGSGGDESTPSNSSSASNAGNGGAGGTGAKNGTAGNGGAGASGVVVLRYMP